MMWIPVTLLAVFSQLFRNMFSKMLSKRMSAETVSLCRFLYGIPLVLLGYIVSRHFFGNTEILSPLFFVCVLLLSVTQMVANILLVALFHQKNFAVAVIYTKTEAIFTALLAFVLLSEFPSLVGWIGIFTTFLGLLLTSFAKENIGYSALKKSFQHKSSYQGIASGIFFGVSAALVKYSFTFLEGNSSITKAVFTLLMALIVQVFLLLPYVFWKRKMELFEILQKPKIPMLIGTFSGLGSFLWFFAFSMTYVAYVKTLGQIEFLFGILVSIVFFKEKIYTNEILGMIIMTMGTALLLFA